MKKYVIGAFVIMALLVSGVHTAKALTSIEAETIITVLGLNSTQSAAIRSLIATTTSKGTIVIKPGTALNCPAGYICGPTNPPINAGTPQVYAASSSKVVVSNATSQVQAVSSGSGGIQAYTVTFNFTLSNFDSSGIYISKVPAVALQTSSEGSSDNPMATSSMISYVSTTPSTLSGDTANAYMIPAGSSRVFSYVGMLYGGSTYGLRLFKITGINYGTSATSSLGWRVNSRLENLRVMVNGLVPVVPSPVLSNGKAVIARISPNSPLERTVLTSSTVPTRGVVLGVFSLQSQGDASTLSSLTFHINSQVTGLSNFTISDGISTYGSINIGNEVTFNNVAIHLPMNAWKDFVLKADVAAGVNGLRIAAVLDGEYAKIRAVSSGSIANSIPNDLPAASVTFRSGNSLIVNNISAQLGAGIIGTNEIVGYNPTFSFTLSNPGSSNIYINKAPEKALVTSTVGSSDSPSDDASRISYVSTSPASFPGDTINAYVIPSGTSRTFTYSGILRGGSVYGVRIFKITGIHYGTSESLSTASTLNGLQNLVVIAQGIPPSNSSWSSNVPVLTPGPTELPGISASQTSISSGNSVKFNLVSPYTSTSNLYFTCASGITGPSCARNINVTSNRDYTTMFYNQSTQVQYVTAFYTVRTSTGLNYSRSVQVAVQPQIVIASPVPYYRPSPAPSYYTTTPSPAPYRYSPTPSPYYYYSTPTPRPYASSYPSPSVSPSTSPRASADSSIDNTASVFEILMKYLQSAQ